MGANHNFELTILDFRYFLLCDFSATRGKTEYLKRDSIKSEFQQEMLIGSLRENQADFAVVS